MRKLHDAHAWSMDPWDKSIGFGRVAAIAGGGIRGAFGGTGDRRDRG
ncbi:MAG: hypothetical protein MH825_09220 [Cyanobacteria bacterium]|nr:hypothetical protein [Cyanobacteriota bacterium]